MKTPSQRTDRRADALSKPRIVAAAIAILDQDGEDALTFRELAARLSTGSGAIYWHVADKNELLAGATEAVVAAALAGIALVTPPHEAIRAVALAVFDAIDVHPWVGTQLSREPWQPAMGQIFERLGQQVEALGVPEPLQFDAASALLNYLLGVAGQNAAAARLLAGNTGREAFLDATADRWARLDPAAYPFVRKVAAQLSGHDDRQQFLAGIGFILAGIAAASEKPK